MANEPLTKIGGYIQCSRDWYGTKGEGAEGHLPLSTFKITDHSRNEINIFM